MHNVCSDTSTNVLLRFVSERRDQGVWRLRPVPTITISAQFTAARTAATDELRMQLVFPETEAGAELCTQLADAL